MWVVLFVRVAKLNRFLVYINSYLAMLGYLDLVVAVLTRSFRLNARKSIRNTAAVSISVICTYGSVDSPETECDPNG
jgi:hypothetical protein